MKTFDHIIPNQTARKSKPHIFWKKNEEKQTKTKYNNIFVFNASKKQNNKQTFPKKHSKTWKKQKIIIENQIFTITKITLKHVLKNIKHIKIQNKKLKNKHQKQNKIVH